MANGSTLTQSQAPMLVLTIHEEASTTAALKVMCGLQDGEHALHKEASPRRVERVEEDVKKMKGCFSSGLMIDTFIHDSDALIIIPTGVVLRQLIWSQALFCESYQTFSLSAFFLPFISVVKAV